jgi:hypothetical protein
MFPPGNDPQIAQNRERVRARPPNRMQGGGGGTLGGRNPMMPRGMPGMGAAPGLGNQVPPPQAIAAMRARQQAQAPVQAPTQELGRSPMQIPGLQPFDPTAALQRQRQQMDPRMQQKMQAAQEARRMAASGGNLPMIFG